MGILGYNAIDDSFVVDYTLISNKVYKLLPIYEGRVKDSQDHIDKNKAYENFVKNLDVLTMEIRGILSKIEFHQNLSEVYIALEGLKGISIDSHDIVRNTILHCVNLLKQIGG